MTPVHTNTSVGQAAQPGKATVTGQRGGPSDEKTALTLGKDRGRIYSIGIAGLRVVSAPDCIRTVLGSCIGIALYDRVAKVGGMAHVILPESSQGSGDPRKFADTAVSLLLENLLEHSAEPNRIAAKIAGGAAMFGDEQAATLGQRNVEAVEAQLKRQAIRLVASAIGGTKGRKMMLDPATGDVKVEIIGEAPKVI